MVERFLELIEGKRLVAFTGSGASAESGIPTFRGKGGLWEKYDPAVYATLPQAFFTFIREPERIAGFIIESYKTFIAAEPNAVHHALAALEKQGRLCGVITQNIDNLHQFAGTQAIAELHGNVYRFFCRRCGWFETKTKEQVKELITELGSGPFSRSALKRKILAFQGKCRCGKRLVTSVIFFGQALPAQEFEKAASFVEEADVLLSIGTSGVVMPAAMVPLSARQKGCTIVEINPEPTELSYLADLRISEPASAFFSKLLD